jgi:hypothetical protein
MTGVETGILKNIAKTFAIIFDKGLKDVPAVTNKMTARVPAFCFEIP